MTGEGSILPLHGYQLRAIKHAASGHVVDMTPAGLELVCSRCGLQLAEWPAGQTTMHIVVHAIRLHEDSAHEAPRASAADRAGWDPRDRQLKGTGY